MSNQNQFGSIYVARKMFMHLVHEAVPQGFTERVNVAKKVVIYPISWVEEKGQHYLVELGVAFRDEKVNRKVVIVNAEDTKVRWGVGTDPTAARSDHENAMTIIVFSTLSAKLAAALGKSETVIQEFNKYRDQNEAIIREREQQTA